VVNALAFVITAGEIFGTVKEWQGSREQLDHALANCTMTPVFLPSSITRLDHNIFCRWSLFSHDETSPTSLKREFLFVIAL
jgi:hypothetical protein